MKDLQGKAAIITGAGSGIGQALALALANSGCRLGLSDLDERGLEETRARVGSRVEAHVFRVDVADRRAMQQFAADAIASLGTVDIVINNAGVALDGDFDQLSYEDLDWLLGINLWGVIHGCKEFLPHLKGRPEASLVNISSVFGLISYPGQSAYNISKFGVRGLSEALRQELRGTGVTVTSVHPGGVKTNIARAARTTHRTEEERQALIEAAEKLFITSPAAAAQTIVAGIRGKRSKVLVGPDARFIDALQRVLPTAYDSILARLYPRPDA